MKNFSDTIGNRTRDLPVCSAVPQPTALQRAHTCTNDKSEILPVDIIVTVFNKKTRMQNTADI